MRVLVCGSLFFTGCGGASSLQMMDGSDYRAYAKNRDGSEAGTDPSMLRFKEGLCDGEPSMRPEHETLTEQHIVEYLRRQNLDVRLERPRADLVYIHIAGAGTQAPVRMRVAILETADKAGAELHNALLQHGPGSWGVHRSNLAALVPTGPLPEAITFAAKTKLACWGVFTVADTDDTFVVPGAYLEL